MAVPVNIDDLINHRTVESTRIEYKAGFNPEAVVHTICAFANDIDNMGGGYIIIGVEEQNGEPVFPVCGVPKNSAIPHGTALFCTTSYSRPFSCICSAHCCAYSL